MMIKTATATACLLLVALSASCAGVQGFMVAPHLRVVQRGAFFLKSTDEPIVSPFDNSASDDGSSEASVATGVATETLEGPLELTWENVEKVLDEMRPFLIQDGGNVAIKEIDGPVVRLELQVSG